MNFKSYITEDEHKRTLTLLYNVRQKFGIYVYMTLKKMLTVGIIIEHYQQTYKRGPWISYNTLLSRYERCYDSKLRCERQSFVIDRHGSLYSFRGEKILDYNQSQVEAMVINRCENEFSKYALPKQ